MPSKFCNMTLGSGYLQMGQMRIHYHTKHLGQALIANLSSWNIRGPNWTNKQEKVKLFLCSHNMGMVCLLELR